MTTAERQITFARCGHVLTNINVWSADSRWIVYDIRSDSAGAVFDGSRIERIDVNSFQVEVLYESQNLANCGVVSFSPADDRIVFIQGPEHPTSDWSYAANHRQGLIVSLAKPALATNLDARDLVPPFTAGALRGGTHLHVVDGLGQWVSFTYEDAAIPIRHGRANLRTIGISVPRHSVRVPKSSPRNCDADYFSVLVTLVCDDPNPGSDQIKRACEEGWVGTSGYVRADGSRQQRAIAFQGAVVTAAGDTIFELFVVDLPTDVTVPGNDGPLQGTTTQLPAPPLGCDQRRLTYTTGHKHPGLQGPRHWTHSSPDGSRIAFLMKDDNSIVQIYTVSPIGGSITQVTRNPWPIASAFSWSRDGRHLAHVMDNSVFLTEVVTGNSRRLTQRSSDDDAPRPEACVISPDGRHIAFARHVTDGGARFNQIFVVSTT
jgi:hypothetical protein